MGQRLTLVGADVKRPRTYLRFKRRATAASRSGGRGYGYDPSDELPGRTKGRTQTGTGNPPLCPIPERLRAHFGSRPRPHTMKNR
jgi:hypothetical protein